jgi:hypothetical protein
LFAAQGMSMAGGIGRGNTDLVALGGGERPEVGDMCITTRLDGETGDGGGLPKVIEDKVKGA